MITIPTTWNELSQHTNILVGRKQLLGTLAHWAVRQSPYPCPDNLHIVLQKLDVMWRLEHPGMDQEFASIMSMSILDSWLLEHLGRMPEFVAWNERKNGNWEPFQFCSRFDGLIDPDNDFIDLGALTRNVAMEVWMESVRSKLQSEEYERRRQQFVDGMTQSIEVD